MTPSNPIENNAAENNAAEKTAAENLCDPDDAPNAAVVIWDGKCNFCRAQVERLRRFDSRQRLAYLSLHDPRVAQRYPDLSFDQLMEQMWVVAPDCPKHNRRKYGGADAVRFLSRYLPRLWWLAPAMHLPFAMPLWRWLYKVVANRRYRLAGANCDGGTCQLHLRTASSTAKTQPK